MRVISHVQQHPLVGFTQTPVSKGCQLFLKAVCGDDREDDSPLEKLKMCLAYCYAHCLTFALQNDECAKFDLFIYFFWERDIKSAFKMRPRSLLG